MLSPDYDGFVNTLSRTRFDQAAVLPRYLLSAGNGHPCRYPTVCPGRHRAP